jgi:hypothetical protein
MRLGVAMDDFQRQLLWGFFFLQILMFPIVFHMVSLKNNSERNCTKIHGSFLKIASSLSFEIVEMRGFCYSNFCFP